jgi:hypothetical protein
MTSHGAGTATRSGGAICVVGKALQMPDPRRKAGNDPLTGFDSRRARD